jgi:transcriptional regulator with XRE-family HTH domain
MNGEHLTDQALLATLGERLAQRRLASGLTQADLAREAGIGRSTVERMEAGRSTQMSSFLRVLRVLDLLAAFDRLIPEQGPSPMQLIRNQSRARQRASGNRGQAPDTGQQWQWADDQ